MDWLRGIGESSLRAGLLDCGLRDLPAVYCDGGGFWLRGLVLMERIGGVRAWCRCERDGRGVMRVVRDYCEPARKMVGVLRIHPFEYLDAGRYGVVYRDEGHCRLYLERFYSSRMSTLVGSGGLSERSYERLRSFTEERVRLCRVGSSSDLGWLDRERMILCQREDSSRSLMDGVEVGERLEMTYGEEVRTLSAGSEQEAVRARKASSVPRKSPPRRTSSSSSSGGASPSGRRGRPRKVKS